MVSKRKHIVVLGAGFGGLTFCKEFSHPDAHVTLVDRANHHLFQPLLYQVAMAGLAAPDIAQPIRSILSKAPNLRVLMDDVRDFDLAGKRVICAQSVLEYDYLVAALGSTTSYFGHSDWADKAPGLKTLEDALLIRRNVLLAFEQAENRENPREQERLMTIVVVGGGPTGIELAGACAELAHRVLRRDFDRIDPGRARIYLVEGSDRLLSHFPAELSEKARTALEKLGVRVKTGIHVSSIEEGKVSLNNGEQIEAGNVLWAAGVMAHPLAGKLGAPVDRGGRVQVNPDLSLPNHPEVFAIGDIAAVRQADGSPVPGVAPAAMQMARHAVRLIQAELDAVRAGTTSTRPNFQYRDKGTLATIGRSAGVAVLGKFKLHGFIAWIAWLVVHLIFLIGFRNKVSVLSSWAYSYFTYQLGARIITGCPEPIRAKEASEVEGGSAVVWR